MWLPPTLALACGVIASGQLNELRVVPTLVATLITVGLWPAFWIALAETDWAAPLQRWRAWDKGDPLPSLPYAVPGSDADRLVIVLGKFRAWVRDDLFPNYGANLEAALIAPATALILAAVLGSPAVALTIVAICLPQIALLTARGTGQPNPMLRAEIEVALPLLMGCSLLRAIPIELIGVAMGFAVAYTGVTTGRAWTWNIGLSIVLATLILTRHSIGVFGVGLCWLPQFLAQASPTPRHAIDWLYLSMIVTAFSLG